MHFSRVVRMSFLVLFLGVGLWCGLVLPSLFSQEGAFPKPQTQIAFQPPAAGGGVPGGSPAGFGPAGSSSTGSIAFPDPQGGAPPAGAGGSPTAAGTGSTFGFLDEDQGGGAGGIGDPFGYGAAAPPPMGMSGMGAGMMSGGMSRNPYQAEEIKLARTAKNLLSAYAREKRPEVKEKLKSDLRSVLHQQFRLQHQRRDSELVRIEKRLADLRSRLKKRADAQSTIVDRRLEQLVNDVDGLGWNAEEIPDNLFNEGMSGGMMMPGMGGMGSMGGGMGAPGMMRGGRGGRGGGTSNRTGAGAAGEGDDFGSSFGQGTAAPEGGTGTESIPPATPGIPGATPAGGLGAPETPPAGDTLLPPVGPAAPIEPAPGTNPAGAAGGAVPPPAVPTVPPAPGSNETPAAPGTAVPESLDPVAPPADLPPTTSM